MLERKLKYFFLKLTTNPIIEPIKRKLLNITFYIQKFNRSVFYEKYIELINGDEHKHKEHMKRHKKHK